MLILQHVRKDHHNQLEKVRRKELGACYGSMKRFVKRLTGGRSGGRDSVLAVAHVLLRRELESFKIQKQKYKMNAEVLREMLPSIDSKHRAQVTEVMNNYLKMSEEPFETEQGLADTKSDDGWEDQEEEEESDEDNEDEEVDVDAIADLVPHIDDEDEDEDEDDGYIGDEDCDKDLSSEALLEELQE
ncbi:hypothetical protein ACOMHN_052208 [Nucella lapillus]